MGSSTCSAAKPRLIGVDFTSAPTRRKPITVAHGRREGLRVVLERVDALETLAAFEALLRESGPWLGGFDLPFGLPRELLAALGWPLEWEASIRHYAALSRAEIRETFAAFCAARPAGSKFAHRACDGPAGSSPSMKWVNPPVAWMLHAAVPRILDAGLHMPPVHEGDRQRVALEAYPGLLAREVLGRRSYKSDDRAKQTPERLAARRELVAALERGALRSGVVLALTRAQREALIADPSADRLDAVLCLVQAAWALDRPAYGLPSQADPLEGWIIGA